MKNSAVVSMWGFNAFDCLTHRLYPRLSMELVSRIESFISAYVLYDYVYLNEKYKHNHIVTSLNSLESGVIQFIHSKDLEHSDDMENHISIEPSLYHEAFEELSKDDSSWLYQNDPQLGDELFFSNLDIPELKTSLKQGHYAQIRLWMWCLINEMAELNNSVCVMPLSMNDISKYSINRPDGEFIINRYGEYKQFHSGRMFKFTETSKDNFWAELSHVPPLFFMFLNNCASGKDEVSALAKLRADYSEFRALRVRYTDSLEQSETISDREEIVDEWNRSWETLLKGEFRKPLSIKNTLSSTDVSNILISPETGGVKALLKNYLDNKSYKKSYNTFRVFSDINRDVGSMKPEGSLLKSVFGVDGIVPFKKI